MRAPTRPLLAVLPLLLVVGICAAQSSLEDRVPQTGHVPVKCEDADLRAGQVDPPKDTVYLPKKLEEDFTSTTTKSFCVPKSQRARDVLVLVDRSQTFDEFKMIKPMAKEIYSAIASSAPDVRVALATFSDFPPPWRKGKSGEYPYRLDLDLMATGDNAKAFTDKFEAIMQIEMDDPHQLGSGYEAIYKGARDVNWRHTADKYIILLSDNGFWSKKSEDSPTECPGKFGWDTESKYPGSTKQEALHALREEGVTYIGINFPFNDDQFLPCVSAQNDNLAKATGGFAATVMNVANLPMTLQTALAATNDNRVKVDIVVEGPEVCEEYIKLEPGSFQNAKPSTVVTTVETIRIPAYTKIKRTIKCRVVFKDVAVGTQHVTIKANMGYYPPYPRPVYDKDDKEHDDKSLLEKKVDTTLHLLTGEGTHKAEEEHHTCVCDSRRTSEECKYDCPGYYTCSSDHDAQGRPFHDEWCNGYYYEWCKKECRKESTGEDTTDCYNYCEEHKYHYCDSVCLFGDDKCYEYCEYEGVYAYGGSGYSYGGSGYSYGGSGYSYGDSGYSYGRPGSGYDHGDSGKGSGGSGSDSGYGGSGSGYSMP